MRMAPNSLLSVRSVPVVTGVGALAFNEAATASNAIMDTYRPKNITAPVVTFQNTLLSAIPSNPEPLFAADDAYS
ncbi:hypothetical protein D3C74_422850 [compost metagenome]